MPCNPPICPLSAHAFPNKEMVRARAREGNEQDKHGGIGNLKGDSPSVASMARSIPATWYVGGRVVSYGTYGILYTQAVQIPIRTPRVW